MIRFANPGSDIDHIVKIFKKLYAQLSDFSSFNLNNMADVMTEANMASSKGYVGEEALKRSYAIKDNSRNPLYNQAKMYAEVYRMFGWMNSMDSALEFKFTLLGAHVALSGNLSKPLVELSVVGIYFPSEIVSVRFTNKGNPYFSILKYFNELDFVLCRDEIIIGALNLENSDDEKEFSDSVVQIKKLRSSKHSKRALQDVLVSISDSSGISLVTMQNYTRLVMSLLKYTGWTEETTLNTYGKNIKFLRLTEYGKEIYQAITESKFIRANDLEKLNEKQINALCKIGFLNFLKRANFSVDADLNKLNNELDMIGDIFNTTDIFFNPFQTFSRKNILRYFPEGNLDSSEQITKEFSVKELEEIYRVTKQQSEITSVGTDFHKNNNTAIRINEILEENHQNENSVLDKLFSEILYMKQSNFYPLVAELFQIIFQLDARIPQAGVNNERIDVILPDDEYSIPVEVKSPTEEMMLSVKAIRQALENKIILLSRKQYPSEKSTSSLAVGFNIPNDRSDVYLLIEDIKKTFDINIAITDIKDLLKAAINCLQNNKKYNIADFKNIYGVIKFEDL